MPLTPQVIQIQGENISYNAKGAFIRRALVDLGFEDGGAKDRESFLAASDRINGAILVLADAYHLHEDPALADAMRGHFTLVAPSVLRAAEAVHAESIGATVLLPASQQKGFEDFVAKGTVLLLDKIPAVPLSAALDSLNQSNAGRAAVAAMRRIVLGRSGHSFIYPPGHFSAENGPGKEKLTDKDVSDMVALIESESVNGVLVICGGRVDADVVGSLKNRFVGNADIEILSQNNQTADLPSAYAKIVRDSGRLPHRVLIDALAGTTLEVVAESAGLSGAEGLSLITSEKMAGNARREAQVVEHFNAYGAKSLVSLGKTWDAPVSEASVLSAPDLKTALQLWAAARGLIPNAPLGTVSSPEDNMRNKGPR